LRTLPWTTLFVLLALPLAASADAAGFELDRFHPAPTSEDGLALVLPRTLGHLQSGFGVTIDYAHESLVRTRDGEVESVPVEHRLRGHASLALGLGSRVELFVRMPILLLHRGDAPMDGEPSISSKAAAGSLHAGMSLRLLGADDGPLSLGLTGWVEAPTGKRESLMGDDGVGAGGLVTGAAHTHTISFAVNVGARYRPSRTWSDVEVGPELMLGAGAYIYAGDYVTFLGELTGHIAMRDWGEVTTRSAPLETLLGLRAAAPDGIVFTVGGGVGLTEAVGVPDYRGLFQVAYPAPRAPLAPEDSDGDGLRDDRDKCPAVREDRDGFRDDDGCIDADNDGDGMSDARDKCPDEAEDRDETEDDDGCIDADNDKDGIADAQDECPNATEDLDGFEDANGCPDLDNDGDALTDLRDQCPEEPEDGDGFADEDGCPDPDNDKDKVADLEDKCPTVPGPASSKGCPSAVRVDRAQIRILQRIEFPTRGAKIRPESLVVIDQVRSVLEVNPQIRRVRIEGHTDDRGATARNAKLSQKRAEAVMQYLVRSGVHPGRLEAKGWGEERPLVKNDTPANMQINRRVEFHIVDPAPPQTAVPPVP